MVVGEVTLGYIGICLKVFFAVYRKQPQLVNKLLPLHLHAVVDEASCGE